MPQIPRFLLPILLTEHWDAALTMPKIPKGMPLLMLSGGKDELVPPSHMRELRRIREEGLERRDASGTAGVNFGEKKQGDAEEKAARVRWREYPLGGHNDTCLIPDYWKDISEWIKEEVE